MEPSTPRFLERALESSAAWLKRYEKVKFLRKYTSTTTFIAMFAAIAVSSMNQQGLGICIAVWGFTLVSFLTDVLMRAIVFALRYPTLSAVSTAVACLQTTQDDTIAPGLAKIERTLTREQHVAFLKLFKLGFAAFAVVVVSIIAQNNVAQPLLSLTLTFIGWFVYNFAPPDEDGDDDAL